LPLSDSPFLKTRLYAVEISGWDSTQNFFVENCDLLWDDEQDKRVRLNQRLPNNALLFVRLLRSGDPDARCHPVVYEAQFVGKAAGMHEFRLRALLPKAKEEASSW
jgi:hypothetical protein